MKYSITTLFLASVFFNLYECHAETPVTPPAEKKAAETTSATDVKKDDIKKKAEEYKKWADEEIEKFKAAVAQVQKETDEKLAPVFLSNSQLREEIASGVDLTDPNYQSQLSDRELKAVEEIIRAKLAEDKMLETLSKRFEEDLTKKAKEMGVYDYLDKEMKDKEETAKAMISDAKKKIAG